MSWDDTENFRMGGVFQWPSLKEVHAYRATVRDIVSTVIASVPIVLPITATNPLWVRPMLCPLPSSPCPVHRAVPAYLRLRGAPIDLAVFAVLMWPFASYCRRPSSSRWSTSASTLKRHRCSSGSCRSSASRASRLCGSTLRPRQVSSASLARALAVALLWS